MGRPARRKAVQVNDRGKEERIVLIAGTASPLPSPEALLIYQVSLLVVEE